MIDDGNGGSGVFVDLCNSAQKAFADMLTTRTDTVFG